MIYDNVRSKIVRQELDIVEAGPHFKLYSAKVKYLPENIEKGDFFNLCYGMLKKGDEIILYTQKKDAFEMFYKFLVIDVDAENKIVETLTTRKVDLMNKTEIIAEEALPEGATPMATSDISDAKITNMIGENIDKALSPVLEKLAKVEEFIETVTQYTKDTDDQLEEIENNIAALQNPKPTKEAKTTKAK